MIHLALIVASILFLGAIAVWLLISIGGWLLALILR
jgi:hypothetical protein